MKISPNLCFDVLTCSCKACFGIRQSYPITTKAAINEFQQLSSEVQQNNLIALKNLRKLKQKLI